MHVSQRYGALCLQCMLSITGEAALAVNIPHQQNHREEFFIHVLQSAQQLLPSAALTPCCALCIIRRHITSIGCRKLLLSLFLAVTFLSSTFNTAGVGINAVLMLFIIFGHWNSIVSTLMLHSAVST